MASTSEKRANRLIHETSPYLRQHAYNPVDWYPWGEEALQKARDENRPIFLSIGYSACHWCHVMEHESFEDEQIAELMNRHFVNIKVDREERPDLDQIYMNSVLALTGRGGWPMSVFLTPDLKPFFGGTYWPPDSRTGLPGFREVLQKVNEAWESRRDAVQDGADQLAGAIEKMSRPRWEQADLDESVLRNAMNGLLNLADRRHGGFGQAPKFPHPMDVRFALRAWKRFGSQETLDVSRLTLDKMAAGGIYDHLGGGFHRYSTDECWLVPHFEKMLYDNALLALVYLEAFQATGEADYARVVHETLDYVLREMTQPQGGFYSTQDADSEGVEGKFFVWTEDEINEHLEPEDARVFAFSYDVSPQGNWEGKCILNRVKSDGQSANMLNVDRDELDDRLHRARRKLFEARQHRVAPGRDEKILASWNGLMISAFAQAAQVLGEPKYTDAATQAADFILGNMREETGRLRHSYKDGQARFKAYLDDYACLIDALVDVYQATFEPSYLEVSLALAEDMLEHFLDVEEGGFFYTSDDHEELVTRNKDTQDTATPSGNSMAATALLRLGRLCGKTDLEEQAVQTLSMLSGQMAQMPTACGQALIALDFHLGPAYEVVLVDADSTGEGDDVLAALHRHFLPNKVVLRRSGLAEESALPEPLRPVLAGKSTQDNRATVFLCERGACQAPVTGVDGLESKLSEL